MMVDRSSAMSKRSFSEKQKHTCVLSILVYWHVLVTRMFAGFWNLVNSQFEADTKDHTLTVMRFGETFADF